MRALQRSNPWPEQVSVTVPAPVALVTCPLARFPVNPGATIRQPGAGWLFGSSETEFMQVIFTGPVTSADDGWTPP